MHDKTVHVCIPGVWNRNLVANVLDVWGNTFEPLESDPVGSLDIDFGVETNGIELVNSANPLEMEHGVIKLRGLLTINEAYGTTGSLQLSVGGVPSSTIQFTVAARQLYLQTLNTDAVLEQCGSGSDDWTVQATKGDDIHLRLELRSPDGSIDETVTRSSDIVCGWAMAGEDDTAALSETSVFMKGKARLPVLSTTLLGVNTANYEIKFVLNIAN